jgi:heptosyltransferase-2
MNRLVILAPNWLGDAVMALPAVADVHRAAPDAVITVAARAAVAPLFRLVPHVSETVVLERPASVRRVSSWRAVGAELAGGGFDTALLLPNSLHAALIPSRAGIPERWGYRTSWRGRLLTKAIRPTTGLHQVDYYQHLVHALGFPNGPIEPRLTVTDAGRDAGARALGDAGWDGRAPLVALAPGAAFGGAKRWPPARFAALAEGLMADGVRSVLVGSAADAGTGAEVLRAASGLRAIFNLIGRTDLPTLSGVLAACRALVTNDSGAMHFGAAVGVRVTGVFGPTSEDATRPMGDGHAVLTHPVWCRPCMLRECPLDHRCLLGIGVDAVLDATRRSL